MKVDLTTSEEANWARNWSSAFYLDVKTSSYIHQTEFYACKMKSFCEVKVFCKDIFVKALFLVDLW